MADTTKATEGVQKVSDDITKRAKILVTEGHSTNQILKSAFNDMQALGGDKLALMSLLATGNFTQRQSMIIEVVAVKILAVLGTIQGNKT